MTYKRISLLLLALLLMICGTAVAEGETFRNGKVLEIEGDVTVTRSTYGMPVYAQLMIQSGDMMETAEDGWAVVCLDGDKYLIMEPDTKVNFELEGSPSKGMIRIALEKGAIYNDITNLLSDGDSYEITTADGVMAVRGTQFRIESSGLMFKDRFVLHQRKLEENLPNVGTPDFEWQGKKLMEQMREANLQQATLITVYSGRVVATPKVADALPISLGAGEGAILAEKSVPYLIQHEQATPKTDGELQRLEAYQMWRQSASTLILSVEESAVTDPVSTGEVSQTATLPSGSEVEVTVAVFNCGGCGEKITSSAEGHKRILSTSSYCRVLHYECDELQELMGQPTHYCDPSADQYPEVPGDQFGCGAEFECEFTGYHNLCGQCKQLMCVGEHTSPCNNSTHRPCVNKGFTWAAHIKCPNGCGGYLCDGGNHGTCGYCGDGYCDGKDHSTADCGVHCNQQSGVHNPCSFGCSGYLCDGASHNEAFCHVHCTTQSGNHNLCLFGCGGYLCDSFIHQELPCGHCMQAPGDHAICTLCSSWKCQTGSLGHGTAPGQCSYVPPVYCGYCGASGRRHSAQACGQHCTAQAGEHEPCICGGWLCVGEHSEELCGDAVSEPCWACGDPNVFHVPLECDSHCTAQAQSGNHLRCEYCDEWLCNGKTHGDGVCNTNTP